MNGNILVQEAMKIESLSNIFNKTDAGEMTAHYQDPTHKFMLSDPLIQIFDLSVFKIPCLVGRIWLNIISYKMIQNNIIKH